MQCPRCKRDNLPELTHCFYCGAKLASPHPQISVFPPRAKEKRPAGITYREKPRPQIRKWFQIYQFSFTSLNFTLRDLLAILFGFIPGFAPFLYDQPRVAGINFLIGVILITGVPLCWHNYFSNIFFYLLVLLAYAGFLQALWLMGKNKRLPVNWQTTTSYPLLSFALLTFESLFAYFILTQWFYFYRINTNRLAPNFLQNDLIIARRNYYHERAPDYGDMVLYRGRYYLSLGLVIAKPGDEIEMDAEKLLINQQEIHLKKIKLTDLEFPIKFSTKIPEKRYLVLYYPYVQGDPEHFPSGSGWFQATRLDTNKPIALYLPSKEEIHHKVIYTINPPNRRGRW